MKKSLKNLRRSLAGFVERGEVPGLVALVSRGDDVFVEVVGSLAIGSNEPVRSDTIFRIASMSKAVTAAAAMVLVDDGKLDLDEPVDELLPELADRQVLRRLEGPLEDTGPANRAITPRDLLTFTFGFGIPMVPFDTLPIQRATTELELGLGIPKPQIPPPPDEWIRRLGTLPLMHQPGEKWMYHAGSDVAGVLIARASGRTFDSFLQERIFEPLGMKDSGFFVPPEKIDRLVDSYTVDALGELKLYDEARGGQWSRPPAFPGGGGGMVSTADDYLSFARMLVTGGEPILSRASVAEMTRDQLTPAQKAVSSLGPGFFDTHGWGLGVGVTTRTDELGCGPGTYGWDGGLGTSWRSDPRTGVIGILLTQRAMTSPVAPPVFQEFWNSVNR